MTEDNALNKVPPEKAIKSVQYDLFGHFVTNYQSKVSNTVDIWESIPKYFITPALLKKLRTDSGHADPYKWEYTYNNVPCKIKIQPALIEQEDGSYKAFFPSVTEELVEEALKKIFTDQQYGIHDPKSTESWVMFTLRMIQKELKLQEEEGSKKRTKKPKGRSRSISEIKHAIEVMGSCILTIYHENQEVWKGSILQDLTTVGRKEYKDGARRHIARLPLFISHAINSLEYRQFNYHRLMQCDQQLSRWLYKKLINRFKQASLVNDYHFMYSEMKKSGLLQQNREADNRRKAVDALEELVEKRVISKFETHERKEGSKIIDVKYTVNPSMDFVTEQKAANKRKKMNEERAINSGLEQAPLSL